MKTPVLLAVALIAPALCLSPAYAQKKKGGQEGEHKSESKLGAYEPPFPSKMTWVLSSINGKPAAAESTITPGHREKRRNSAAGTSQRKAVAVTKSRAASGKKTAASGSFAASIASNPALGVWE